MNKLYFNNYSEKGLYLLLFTPLIGFFINLGIYLLGFSLFSSFLLVAVWDIAVIIVVPIFRFCLLYMINIREEGIRLYYKRICDYSLREQYRRNGKPVKKDYLLEINREEGWIEIRWEQIKNIWVGRGYIEPRCRIEMVNGDRVYLLNPVDRKIIDEVVKAWKLWKNEKSMLCRIIRSMK